MNESNILIPLLIMSTFSLSALILVISVMYFRLSRVNGRLEERMHKIKSTLDDAFVKKLGEESEREVGKLASSYNSMYQKQIEQFHTDSLATLQEVSKQIQGRMTEEIKVFDGVMREAARKAGDEVKIEVREEYKKIYKEIEEYKNNRLAQIDKEAKKVATFAVKKFLGGAFNIREHEEMLMRALEEAKRDHVF